MKSVIFSTAFGSHLYGTNTPLSDMDFKAVFVQPLEEIILGGKKNNVIEKTNKSTQRNTKDDVDIEYIELRKFLHDCWSGQTYALDMLFAPERFWLEATPIWHEIVSNRTSLLSKNIGPYIGYCRQQAGKYGLKGSRLGEVLRTIEFLESKPPKAPLGEALAEFVESEFARLIEVEAPSGGTSKFLEVLGKKHDLRIFTKDCLGALNKLKDRYGDRALQASQNLSVDWKAVSHAFRCCYQLIELAETGKIIFPLAQKEFLTEIKQGKLDYPPLQEKLYELMESAICAVEGSSLPDEPDVDFWKKFILKTYLP